MLGNKKVMGNNIQFYMNKMGLERADLAKAIGVPYSSLTDWINGKTYPRIDKIERMANYFNIEKSDLVEERSKARKSTANRIPVLGRVAAGMPIDAIENVIDYEEVGYDTDDYFALQIHGNSMEPRMYEGDVVIVRRQEDAENGEIVIITVNGDDATCKRLMKYPGGIALVSLNPVYQPMMFSKEDAEQKPIRVLGKVVEIRGKMMGI